MPIILRLSPTGFSNSSAETMRTMSSSHQVKIDLEKTLLRLLFVEEDEVDRVALLRFVEEQRLPYAIQSVVSTAEAREALAAHQFDLVLFAHVSKSESGLDILEAIKAPVIFVTGAESPEMAVRALKAGARDYLIKDIDRRYLQLLSIVVERVIKQAREDLERKRTEQALRRSEELFRAIVEDQTEMIVRWKPDGTRTFVNQAYCRTFGKRYEELVGSSFFPLVKEEYREAIRKKILSLTPANPLATEIHESISPTGEILWQEWTDRGLFDAEGRLVELQSAGRDITGRRVLEDQLRQAQKMEAIGQLAGGIAHDFNNILGAILGNAHVARMDLEEGHAATGCVDEIQKAALRAKALVRQILAFSRQEAPERRVVSLESIVDDATQLLKATLPAGVDFRTSVAPETPTIFADATQIQQILLNLATNAWQALEGKAGRVEIHVEGLQFESEAATPALGFKPGHYVCICVSDTGKGMDAATLQRIYDPFFTTKAPGEGTGLGLSVVHGIVQNHEGVILVTSQPGVGTTFRIYLPPAEGIAENSVDTPSIPAELARGNGQSILCVDDEEPLLMVAQHMLERLGYEVTGVNRPSDALMLIRENPSQFDLILTDMNMPTVSGLQLAEEILKIRPETPLILCSGYITDQLKREAQRLGVRKIIHKPYTLNELSEGIHSVLARNSQSG